MYVSSNKTFWYIEFNDNTDYESVWGYKAARKRKKELVIGVIEGELSLYSKYGQGMVFARIKF